MNWLDNLNYSITSSNAKLLVTTRKQRLQMWILTGMNLNSFQKQCRIRSKNTKKKVRNVSYKSIPTSKKHKPKKITPVMLAYSGNFIRRGCGCPNIYLVCCKTDLGVPMQLVRMELLLSSCQHSVKFSYFEGIRLFPAGNVQDSPLTYGCIKMLHESPTAKPKES